MSKARLLSMMAGVLLAASCSGALAQATSRSCNPDAATEDRAGPACLMSHVAVGALPDGEVYWHLYQYPDAAAAARAKPAGGAVVAAFGHTWLFTVGARDERLAGGQHVADVGPIAVNAGVSYDAEFLKSTFSVGMTAPIHVHSGPEAFYALSGDTCLETPDGVQFGRGPGNSLVIRGGPPMLLMAPGPEPRKGFALILHDHAQPPTTLVQHWTPKGLCQAVMR
ncbi:hypothetical protein ACLB1G_07165 [Oxalobacteraceae bacterium A2-2]